MNVVYYEGIPLEQVSNAPGNLDSAAFHSVFCRTARNFSLHYDSDIGATDEEKGFDQPETI